MLYAFRSYPIARSFPAMLVTTGTPEAPAARSSRTEAAFPSGGNTPCRYYRTVFIAA